ncbi:uncharacterized protein LOC110390337 [Numida meleagris]|uniref:uncharacterized protein LOC110390337 n=1 Tax=Numida meleagris TaxID=8996 RepID=UPI000B3DE640|nr:uncharacterized protein LOC110390337 [Numida meleagris]
MAKEAWTCPVCRDVRWDIAYAVPCNHKFCVGCINRWARLRASCPLCRTAMKTTRVPVRGENQYVEFIVSPPAVPVPVGFGPATGPSGTAASAPPSPEHRDVEAARVGGLLPEEWAALFRERRDLLCPVLPWLEDIFSQIQELRWWQIAGLESVILALLCQVGLDRDTLVQRAQHALGPITALLIDTLIEIIVSRCGQEARRLLGLEDPSAAQEQEAGPAALSGPAAPPPGTVASGSSAGPDAEELPHTSSGALGGGAGELTVAPSPGEREQPDKEPEQEAAGPSEQGRSHGPSARSRGRKRSAGGPRRPTKRRAGSAQRAPPPCKRRPPRRL